MATQPEPDMKVSDLTDWMLSRLPATRHTFTRDEIINWLLDMRNEFDQ